jgi:hypothetical protein
MDWKSEYLYGPQNSLSSIPFILLLNFILYKTTVTSVSHLHPFYVDGPSISTEMYSLQLYNPHEFPVVFKYLFFV